MQEISQDSYDFVPTCCVVNDVCGYSLKEGIVIVAVTAIIVSLMMLVGALVFLFPRTQKELYNSNPMKAINFVTALICFSTSLYQIGISLLLLWFLRWKQTGLLLKLWYISNLALLTIFSFLIVARAMVFLSAKEYKSACFHTIFGVIYEVVFYYFYIIVTNYESTLDPERTYW